MNTMSRFIQREWELLLCLLAAVLLIWLFGDWLLRSRGAAPASGSSRLDEAPSILGPDAFAFLQEPVPAPAAPRDPFLPSLAGVAPARSAERPARREPPKPPTPEPRPAPVPVPAAPPEPPPATVVPPPAAVSPAGPRLGVCDLRYVFSSVNRSGRPVALVELQDPAHPGGAPVARNVSAGDVVLGLRIQSFSDDALQLVDAAGRKHSVAFGGTRRVAVDTGGRP